LTDYQLEDRRGDASGLIGSRRSTTGERNRKESHKTKEKAKGNLEKEDKLDSPKSILSETTWDRGGRCGI